MNNATVQIFTVYGGWAVVLPVYMKGVSKKALEDTINVNAYINTQMRNASQPENEIKALYKNAGVPLESESEISTLPEPELCVMGLNADDLFFFQRKFQALAFLNMIFDEKGAHDTENGMTIEKAYETAFHLKVPIPN